LEVDFNTETMEARRRLQVLAILLLTIGLYVSGQSTDYSNVAFVGKVIDVKLVEAGLRRNSISVSTNSGDLQDHIVMTGTPPSIYSVTCTVEKLYYSHYPEDTIVFLTYTEKSEPSLSYYTHVFCLLKLNDAGKYETFRQYYDAYQTNKGEWVAGFYSGWMLDSDYFLENFKKVAVKKKQYVDMQLFTTKSVTMKGLSVYYKIKGDKAIPKVGIPVDGLMKQLLLKKVF